MNNIDLDSEIRSEFDPEVAAALIDERPTQRILPVALAAIRSPKSASAAETPLKNRFKAIGSPSPVMGTPKKVQTLSISRLMNDSPRSPLFHSPEMKRNLAGERGTNHTVEETHLAQATAKTVKWIVKQKVAPPQNKYVKLFRALGRKPDEYLKIVIQATCKNPQPENLIVLTAFYMTEQDVQRENSHISSHIWNQKKADMPIVSLD